jgi:hypothetical protein
MMGALGFVVESRGSGFRPHTRSGLGTREVKSAYRRGPQPNCWPPWTMARGMDAGNQLDNSRAT